MMSKIKVSLTRRNASKREKLVTGFVIMTAMVFLWIEGTTGTLQPNLTSVESWGETQIKVTWQPFEHVGSDKPHYYELYIDDYLEYFGNDLIYIARRLTPDTTYHFKLRSCIQDSQVCSLCSKTLSGTTDQSRKRSFTKSFIHWTILCLVITFFSCAVALLGAKITRRLWRSFLYRNDYRSETNLQLPQYVASTGTMDEDIVPLLCEVERNLTTDIKSTSDKFSEENFGDKHEMVVNKMEEDKKKTRNYVKNVQSSDMKKNVKENDKYDKFQNKQASIDVNNLNNAKEYFERKDVSGDLICYEDKFYKYCPIEDNTKYACNTEQPAVKMDHDRLSNCGNKGRNSHVSAGREIAGIPSDDLTKEGNFTIQRANSSPKIMRDTNSKRKDKGHQRARSFDSNMQNNVALKDSQNMRNIENNFLTHSALASVTHSSDVVVVVDNSNIFIGAQECANLRNPLERKRNIRVKIQHLVKVFQRGRGVSRAFVQGSSPPASKQVWEVYRHLGYCVDLEDRRGKDEQRVDEGLHLHIYKALFELSPRTLVIASGDGNKGKSECATSLPGCAEAAIARGWSVEVHSWQHSTSMEWLKISKKCPEHLTIRYLDRYVNQITFVDGKNGRKCQPFPTGAFKVYEYLK